ncbi:nitrophenyl compound nitroreductase subunit ArsF family protein [Flavobacterium aquiphilum]|uniref:nitrophenyl compound nitroreductase subunit ArsF family protein n=1 Tax=Flavobacterium aquiphilum TaxID=3003261 RepID=UPI0024801172|nr:nitrophenyl compound nitroreductase subunit ArsF family protein [Flavobacterium aquiphilum]
MSKKKFLAFVFTTLMMLSVSFIGNAQTKNVSTVQVIQFHSEHRCMTCNKIEELTKVALKKYPTIPFSLVNADDKKNEKLCTQFQAYGSSLFLYNTKTKKIQNLTEMAFMNAGDQDKFVKEFNKKMDAFLKS